MILGGLGASGADLAKKVEQCIIKLRVRIPYWGPFSTIIAKMWASKNRLFFRPCIFGQKSAQGPQSEHHGRSGAQKVAKIEPKMMTFRGPAKKLEKVAKFWSRIFTFGGPFSTIIPKMWASKNILFFRPCIFGPKSAQGPPK